MPQLTIADVTRMRAAVFFEAPDAGRKVSRFWLLLTLAGIIASAGVVADSTATVIGAMIVAPLMTPILGIVIAIGLADRRNLVRCLVLLAAGTAATIAIGYLVGLIIELPVNEAANSQVAGRVEPRLIDLVAALATGAVGSIALAREDISDTLPGVAIAISLVPPLSVVGLTLEAGEHRQALGALLLFATNVCAILATGIVVMAIYLARQSTVEDERDKATSRRATLAIVASVVLIALPLAATTVRVTRDRIAQSNVSNVADRWAERHGWDIAQISFGRQRTVIRATGPEPEPETESLRREMPATHLGGPVVIELVPTETRTLVPGGK